MTSRYQVKTITGLVLCSILASFSAISDEINPITNPDNLRDGIHQFVRSLFNNTTISSTDIQLDISDIDTRLKLSPCDNNLTFSMAQETSESIPAGRRIINIRCDKPAAWSIFVPVIINVWQELPVLTSSRKRGDNIRPQDISTQRQNLAKLKGQGHYLTDLAQITGKTLSRSLAAGSVLYPELLIEPDLVKKGDQVTLMLQSGNITVSSTGTAQQNGKQGDQISVVNLTSNRTMTGRIIDKNTVGLAL